MCVCWSGMIKESVHVCMCACMCLPCNWYMQDARYLLYSVRRSNLCMHGLCPCMRVYECILILTYSCACTISHATGQALTYTYVAFRPLPSSIARQFRQGTRFHFNQSHGQTAKTNITQSLVLSSHNGH